MSEPLVAVERGLVGRVDLVERAVGHASHSSGPQETLARAVARHACERRAPSREARRRRGSAQKAREPPAASGGDWSRRRDSGAWARAPFRPPSPRPQANSRSGTWRIAISVAPRSGRPPRRTVAPQKPARRRCRNPVTTSAAVHTTVGTTDALLVGHRGGLHALQQMCAAETRRVRAPRSASSSSQRCNASARRRLRGEADERGALALAVAEAPQTAHRPRVMPR